jgi:hypothetical protein
LIHACMRMHHHRLTSRRRRAYLREHV